MLITPHAAAGAAIAVLLPHPISAVPTAIASHFILDSIPHWQETLAPYIPTWKTYVRIPIDAGLAVALILVITHWHANSAGVIWLGAFMANSPDLDSVVALWPRTKRGVLGRYWDWHCRIQRETSSWLGLLPQIAVIGLALIVTK